MTDIKKVVFIEESDLVNIDKLKIKHGSETNFVTPYLFKFTEFKGVEVSGLAYYVKKAVSLGAIEQKPKLPTKK